MILGILTLGESYGYAMIQRARELSGGHLEWSEGMLYPMLHRLEKEKLVESFWRESESARKRKYYRITSKGLEASELERTQWSQINQTLTQVWKLRPHSI